MADLTTQFEIVNAGEMPSSLAGHTAIDSDEAFARALRIKGLKDGFGRAVDAGETLITARNALQHVQEQTYNRYRPTKFRTFFNVTADVPEWADEVVYEIFSGYAKWEPGKEDGTTFPGAEINKAEGRFKVKDFWSSYGYTRLELLKAARTGTPLQQGRANVVFQGGEQTLDEISFNGHSGTGLGGIRGLTGVTAVVSSTKTTSGTVWQATTPLYELINDLLLMRQGVRNGSKETSECNFILLPQDRMDLLEVMRNTTTDRRALALIAETLSGVTLAGATKLNGTGEMYGYDRLDQEVLQMVIPIEPKQEDPLLSPMGAVRIPCMFSAGGIVSKMPKAVGKMTGI
jgi:hypothetical protein